MNVIFLDIDGVLNFGGCKARAPSGCLGISDSKVKLLKQIVDASDARIALTSTWKKEYCPQIDFFSEDAKYMIRKLKRAGLHILDKTKQDNILDRGQGIYKFLRNHLVQNWVVIDDDQFRDYDTTIKRHFVHTDFLTGLTQHHVKQAIEILMPQ